MSLNLPLEGVSHNFEDEHRVVHKTSHLTCQNLVSPIKDLHQIGYSMTKLTTSLYLLSTVPSIFLVSLRIEGFLDIADTVRH